MRSMTRRHLSIATRLRVLAPILGLLILGPTLDSIAPNSVQAVGTYNNATIADKALSYVGQWGGKACGEAGKLDANGTTVAGYGGGQCRTFVNCILYMVSGHTQYPVGTYFQSFLDNGGKEIIGLNSLVKGDIVQIGDGTHTFIIVARVSGSTFTVVDSNNDLRETVTTYNRVVALGPTVRAFRMGTIPPVGPPPFSAPYVGHLVQWNGDTKAQKTSWLVGIDGKRRWIPDAATYNCLASFGAPHAAADILSSTILDQLTDLTGVRATCDALLPNWSMVQGQTLASLSKEYWLTFQTDGNLVLYRTCAAPNAPVALWASFAGTAKKFVMQSDGNFVGYNTLTPTSTNNAVWSTKTANGALSQLLMQSDGNLVVYTASSATWSTGTNGGVSRLTPPQTCPAPPPPPPTCPAGQIGTPPNCTTPPPPTCPAGQIGTPPNCTTPPPPPPTTWVEKVWWTSAGAFSAGPGAGIVSTIQPTGTLVTVDCRAYNLAVATSNTGGWWYHLVSPFAGQWTPASLYWNDPTGTALWDPAVRVC